MIRFVKYKEVVYRTFEDDTLSVTSLKILMVLLVLRF